MKLVLNIFTWCIMFMVILWTLGACTYVPQHSRATYMERAYLYDASKRGTEHTKEYQRCYMGFMKYLWEECKGYVDNRDFDRYWDCAWDALDEMEECTDGGKL